MTVNSMELRYYMREITRLTLHSPPNLSMLSRLCIWLSLVKYNLVLTNLSGEDTPLEYLKV